jgi:hypothetical protein
MLITCNRRFNYLFIYFHVPAGFCHMYFFSLFKNIFSFRMAYISTSGQQEKRDLLLTFNVNKITVTNVN